MGRLAKPRSFERKKSSSPESEVWQSTTTSRKRERIIDDKMPVITIPHNPSTKATTNRDWKRNNLYQEKPVVIPVPYTPIVKPAPYTPIVNPATLCETTPSLQFKVLKNNRACSGVDSRILMSSKACAVQPEHQDVSQDIKDVFISDQYQALLLQQYGFNPSLTPAKFFDQFKPIDRVMFNRLSKVENYSQCANPTTTETGTTSQRMTTETSDLKNNRVKDPKSVQISKTPRLKVISERFSRFKKDNIELRRLEERIICVEYDVYSREDVDKLEPIQVMRAYFCMKTGCESCQDTIVVPPDMKSNIPLEKDTIKSNMEKEIEIIDEKLPENKPYLNDLRKILKKRQAVNAKKQQTSLDLMSMYNMAYNEMPPLDHDWSNTNLLSKAELEEVKDLIAKKCESRVCHLSRKKVPKTNRAQHSLDSISHDFFDKI